MDIIIVPALTIVTVWLGLCIREEVGGDDRADEELGELFESGGRSGRWREEGRRMKRRGQVYNKINKSWGILDSKNSPDALWYKRLRSGQVPT